MDRRFSCSGFSKIRIQRSPLCDFSQTQEPTVLAFQCSYKSGTAGSLVPAFVKIRNRRFSLSGFSKIRTRRSPLCDFSETQEPTVLVFYCSHKPGTAGSLVPTFVKLRNWRFFCSHSSKNQEPTVLSYQFS